MLRITQLETPAGSVLQLEGRLAGPWVDALREVSERDPPRRLDLRGLKTVDLEGLMLLRQLVIDGATLLNPSGYLATLLSESP